MVVLLCRAVFGFPCDVRLLLGCSAWQGGLGHCWPEPEPVSDVKRGCSTVVRRCLCNQISPLFRMKVGKLLGRVNIVCVVVRRRPVPGHNHLITSLLLWLVSVSTACLPHTGRQIVVSLPVASTVTDFIIIYGIATIL
jgi:hypothetical protein